MAQTKLQEYYNQFEELGTLHENSGIMLLYEQLEEILSKNKKILQVFQENVQNTIEMSIKKVELTNYETQQMVDNLFSILH